MPIRSFLHTVLFTVAVLAIAAIQVNAFQTEENPVVQSNNTFAFNLYHAVKEDNDNLVFSPYSIVQAIGMLHAGARGETQQQIATALALPEGEIGFYFADLYALLTAPGIRGHSVSTQYR